MEDTEEDEEEVDIEEEEGDMTDFILEDHHNLTVSHLFFQLLNIHIDRSFSTRTKIELLFLTIYMYSVVSIAYFKYEIYLGL